MTKLEPIAVDRERQCYRVEVAHEQGGKLHVYVVLLKPDPKLVAFRTIEVRNKLGGKALTSDLKYLIGAKAVKRLFGSMHEKLKPIPQPKFALEERVERALVLKLYQWQSEGKQHDRVTLKLLQQLYSCMRRINDRIASHAQEAKLQGRPRGDYFQQFKRDELVKMRKNIKISNEMRDLCAETLSQAYAWRTKKIPPRELEIIEKHLPGFRLMLA